MFQSVKDPNLYTNENSRLPVAAGLVAGVLGTVALLIFVFELMAVSHTPVQAAAQDTLLVLLGADYVPNSFQIIAGTIVHLLISGLLGATFAALPCCFPRGFWVVAGLIYGIGTGVIACYLTKPLMSIFDIPGSVNYFLVMLFNVLYGFLYGLAAATYGLELAFVSNLRRRIISNR